MARSHKYIEKHKSKSGKWVYKYLDTSDWVDPVTYAQRRKKREASKKENIQKIAKRPYKFVNSKARYAYSKVKQSYDNRNTSAFVSKVVSKGIKLMMIKASIAGVRQ